MTGGKNGDGVGARTGTRHPAVSPSNLLLRARREADRQRREMADLNRALVVPLGALISPPENPTPPRLTGSPRPATPSPAVPSEPCPECHAPIALEDAWCRSCGSSRGVATSTPREDYLRACTAALEFLRESHRRVRPLPETRRAEVDLEAAVGRLREGVEL